MPVVKQKQRYCRTCQRKTLHVSTFNKQNAGCGGHIFLTIVTLGLWLPIGIVCWSVAQLGNAFGGLGGKYYCQVCGRKN
ncbi:unnamed protein product [marine sediment metagenome]|uniref:LITAF domain-containing protein n=1 Tax=marine sediment metagenome TaxID=412755 RepID=X1TP75_9ZZZZ